MNEEIELLAVGVCPDDVTWLIRLSKFSGFWCRVREATKKEIGIYDELLLKQWGVSLDG